MSSSSPQPKAIATEVRRPRVCDAIGTALRDAYGKDVTLPDDMVAIIAMLNDGSNTGRHA